MLPDWWFEIVVMRAILLSLGLLPKRFTRVQLEFSNTKEDQKDVVPSLVQGLQQLITEHCPSVSKGSFVPTAWLNSGHSQTMYSVMADTVEEDNVKFKRRTILTPDGGTLTLDISPPHLAQDDNDAIPTIMVLHGLTGGSHEA